MKQNIWSPTAKLQMIISIFKMILKEKGPQPKFGDPHF